MKNYKGEWSIANQPETKVPGILIIDEDNYKTSLQLFSEKEISSKFNRQFVIANSNLGEKISILKCYAVNEERISPNLYISSYSPHFVFIGCHFNSEEELKFKSVKINLTYLNQWLEVRAGNLFKLEIKDNGSFSAEYNYRKDITIKLNEECDLAFQRFCLPKGGFNTPLSTDIKYYATFTFKNHQLFNTFLNLTARLQNILMLFIGKPISIKRRIGYSEKTIDANEINRLRMEDYPVEIFNYDCLEGDIKTKFIDSSEMLISLRNFKIEEIKQLITKWFSDYEKFEAVYDIFFHAIKPFWKGEGFIVSNVTYNNAFLNFVQALESYHRIKTNDASKDNTEFQNVKNRIKQAATCLTQEDKEWIDKHAKPKKGKEYTLNERIDELINNDIFSSLFNNESNIAINLVKWRDSLTHINHSKSTEVQVKDWFNKAQIILIVNIFQDLGISEKKIKQIIHSSHLLRS